MKRALEFIINVLVAVIVVVASLAVMGAALGMPMGISYVETESMSPTITPGEGFVLVPITVAGSPEPGDVVVFNAQELRGGGPTTHRIVEQTERGYITQGDNNNVPDQVTSEPPVERAQIAGQVLEINGRVITIPYTETVTKSINNIIDSTRQEINVLLWRLTDTSGLSTSQFSYVLTGLFLILYLAESHRETDTRHQNHIQHGHGDKNHSEDPVSAHTILLVFTLIIVAATTAAMVVPGGVQQYDVVASETESPVMVPPGEETQITHGIGNSPVLPMMVFVEGGNSVQVENKQFQLDRGGTANASASLAVPDSTGHHIFYVIEHRYIAVLPESVIEALYAHHPWLPIAAINTLIAVPYYLVGRWFL